MKNGMKMNNKRSCLVVITLILVVFGFPGQVFSEKCDRVLNFEETVKAADLIIVGNKIVDDEELSRSTVYLDTDMMLVKVENVLKGKLKNKTIKVLTNASIPDGWGIDMDAKTYVIFLAREKDVSREEYHAVNFGCAVKIYLLEDQYVSFGDELTPIESFVEKINLILYNRKIK